MALSNDVLAEFRQSGLPLEAQSFLADIASGEATRFDELAGGGTFASYDNFPDWDGIWHGEPPQMHSHGAGLFQFEPRTWSYCKLGAKLTDFSPQSQIKAAWWLAQSTYGMSLLNDLRAGRMRTPRPQIFVNQWARAAVAGPPGETYAVFLHQLSRVPITESLDLQISGNVAGLQRLLVRFGYAGKIDGIAGPQTLAALTRVLNQ